MRNPLDYLPVAAMAAVLLAGWAAGGEPAGESPRAGSQARDAGEAELKPQVEGGALAGYKLAWHDEFDGDKLNPAEWDFRTDSRMWSVQKPENVSVADGKLRLAVRKEEAGDKHYTGAGVISKRAFKYGYYESRLKVPPGAGWHTSFWMMWHDGPREAPPTKQELDVCENDSIDPHGYGVNTHLWVPKPHKAFGSKHVKTPDLSADFHVFGCEFTARAVRYYFDGKLVQELDATQFPHGGQNIWLTTIASDLGHTKAVDDAKLPAAAEYDYVRFFEKAQ